MVGSLAVPPWARSDGAQLPGQPLALRQVPGPSPRQTIAHVLATTAQAHQLTPSIPPFRWAPGAACLRAAGWVLATPAAASVPVALVLHRLGQSHR